MSSCELAPCEGCDSASVTNCKVTMSSTADLRSLGASPPFGIFLVQPYGHVTQNGRYECGWAHAEQTQDSGLPLSLLSQHGDSWAVGKCDTPPMWTGESCCFKGSSTFRNSKLFRRVAISRTARAAAMRLLCTSSWHNTLLWNSRPRDIGNSWSCGVADGPLWGLLPIRSRLAMSDSSSWQHPATEWQWAPPSVPVGGSHTWTIKSSKSQRPLQQFASIGSRSSAFG